MTHRGHGEGTIYQCQDGRWVVSIIGENVKHDIIWLMEVKNVKAR